MGLIAFSHYAQSTTGGQVLASQQAAKRLLGHADERAKFVLRSKQENLRGVQPVHVVRVRIRNFRGIAEGEVHFDGHTVLVGDNNAGKSTLLEAIDLVLGPERLARRPVVDEHDFYAGVYVNVEKAEVVPIQTEVVVAGLNEEQQRHFRDHLEWWDSSAKLFLEGPPAEGVDAPHVWAALRVFFNGWYDVEEDDFTGDTYYALPQLPDGGYVRVTTGDKRRCGFLYLRTLRTGARALSAAPCWTLSCASRTSA